MYERVKNSSEQRIESNCKEEGTVKKREEREVVERNKREKSLFRLLKNYLRALGMEDMRFLVQRH